MSVCLVIIDGWGISEKPEGNAVLNANTPVMDSLSQASGQYMTLDASGLAVGLPAGRRGNSEVGHLNIGAGRVTYQDLVRINMDVESGAIRRNEYFVQACDAAKRNTGRLHLLGMVSDGGSHSHISHLFGLLEGAKGNEVPHCFIHFFSDGIDTSRTSGITYVQQVHHKTKEIQYGSLATVIGRYYAMDRDKKYAYTKIAFDGMVHGKGQKCEAANICDLIQQRYEASDDQRETDELLKPIIIDDNGLIRNNDTLIFTNFRTDRMRQIVEALGITQHFETENIPQDLKIFTMTQYKEEFPFAFLYPPVILKNGLAGWISSKGLPQFRCAETAKFSRVTFFFNGRQEQAFPLEDRLMVLSPKVARYDLRPEMNCRGVAEEIVKAISQGKYPFVMCNFAPPDVVGHTGVYDAACKAVEATDSAIGLVLEACNAHGYTLLVTSDHGNAEKMLDGSGQPQIMHTASRVPFCMTGSRKFRDITHNAALCDVAPTVLDLMGLDIPVEMTGQSLLVPL